MPENKRIAFVANTSWSIYRFRLFTIQKLIAGGYEIHVLAPRDRYTTHFENQPGIHYTELKHFENKRISVIKDLALYKELKTHYKRIQPHLIFHYTIKANIFGTLAAGHSHFRSIGIITGLGYAFLANSILQQIARMLYRFSFRYAAEVWFLNQDDRNVFVNLHLVKKEKSFLLPGEGVDTDVFYPAPAAHSNSGEITFLLVGRMMKHKGIYEFIEATGMLKKKGLSVRCQLLGSLDEQSPAAIQLHEIQQWTSRQLITWLGETDNVIPYIAGADCIVLPSYREGLPVSLLEGASMGKFLIAADTAGCRDVVTDNETGYLCRVKDATDLAAKMETYYHLPIAEKNRMGIKGREKILRQFKKEIVAGIYLDKIIEQLQEQPAAADMDIINH